MELFSLTYGALISEIIQDSRKKQEDALTVNNKLRGIGTKLGQRLVDDFLAKHMGKQKCTDFKTTVNVLAQQALPVYLGYKASVRDWDAGGSSCLLVIPGDNPLEAFVELPQEDAYFQGLEYSSIIAGAISGSLG